MITTHKSSLNIMLRIINYILLQTKISYYLIRNFRDVDVIISIYASFIPLPLITAKLMRKKWILIYVGNALGELCLKRDPLLLLASLMLKIDFSLVDNIVLYSPNLIQLWGLDDYKNKTLIGHQHYCDIEKFSIRKNYSQRKNIIGYIGRFSKEKGVCNFVRATSLLLEDSNSLSILICGEGPLHDAIKCYLDSSPHKESINLLGWIPHNDLPIFLNKIKLLILPSFTEGLPTIMLESMSCGTPVLACGVGAIPDIIMDGKNGFILENNSPECISNNIKRVLEYPDLNDISKNARTYIEREFTFDATVANWVKIFLEVN